MLRGLEQYIRSHRKKGFEHSEIARFLHRHGWHQSHIVKAMGSIKKEEAQRFVAGAIWYMLVVFIVTIGIVQVGKVTGAATIDDVYCVTDNTGLNNLQYQTSKKVCCNMVKTTRCTRMERPRLLTDHSGRALYKADISCVGRNTRMLFNEAGWAKCQ